MKLLRLTAVLFAASLIAQVAEKANSGYKTPQGREQVARRLTAPDRDARQLPEELVKHMGLNPVW